MEQRVECTHCRVLMTGWSAAGSRITYWQCPFCGRTHSSLYGEVFRTAAGARLVERASPGDPGPARGGGALPQRTREEIRWAGVRANAKRWFARLEQEGSVAAAEGARGSLAAMSQRAAPEPPLTASAPAPSVAVAGRVPRR